MAHSTIRGISLVEVIIGTAIILTGILALNTAFTSYVSYALANNRNVQAVYIAEEGMEVMTFLRDDSWTKNIVAMGTTDTYYLNWTGTRWATTTTEQYVDGVFMRSIELDPVYRDGANRIASSGTLDQNTRKVTVTVAYTQGRATTTKSFTTYLSNLHGN